ncbi:34680_t:CDS:2, partial [Gigaspora margarita]
YLNKLCNTSPHRPQPTKSEHTIPRSTWTIPINHNKEDIVSIDQNERGERENEINNNVGFPLIKGWALKGSQKLGNRGGARIKKNIKLILERFFLNGNRRSQDRMNAQNMYNELLKYVEAGDIEKEDVPQISTIHNWINAYA